MLYDELMMSELAAGQLSNIYLIQDPILVKQTMVQAIQVLKDAPFLLWQAVRTAYAQSVHQVEQGTLSGQDNTQWVLYRISSSQMPWPMLQHSTLSKIIRKFSSFITKGCTLMRATMVFVNMFVIIVQSWGKI